MEKEQDDKKAARAFAEAYVELCKQHGYELKAEVALKLQNDNTYTIGARLAVVPLQEG